jgi:putative membrane protein insertion efficiency factor
MNWLKKFELILIAVLDAIFSFWKFAFSPFLGSHCRFYPSCSEYGRQALAEHGLIKGVMLTAYRVLRCNPLCKGGIDNVPAANNMGKNIEKKILL